jgi:hypothetical protein
MHLAVNLDDQAAFETGEIADIAFLGKLTPESETSGTSAKLLPEKDLRKSHPLS